MGKCMREIKSVHGSYFKKWKLKALFQYHVRVCQSFHDFSWILSTKHAVLICELLIICSANAEFLLTVIHSQAWSRVPELTWTFQQLPCLLYCDISHLPPTVDPRQWWRVRENASPWENDLENVSSFIIIHSAVVKWQLHKITNLKF